MRPNIQRTALALVVGAIGLSLVRVSVAGTPRMGGGPRRVRPSRIETLTRKLASLPTSGGRAPHAKVATPSNNGPAEQMAMDPALKFISTFGAAANILTIAVDQGGNSYIGGTTEAQGFTTTPGAFEPTSPSGGGGAFVAKIDPSGALVYSTYLCGSLGDVVYGIAVDSAGNAYVTGWAVSTDFPTTPGAFQPSCVPHLVNGSSQCSYAFVAKLNPTGSGLVYSSYLGGGAVTSSSNLGQTGTGIAVDASGSAYVVGHTNASDFPTTPGAFQTSFGGGTCGTSTQPAPCDDAFITKIAPGGATVVYSTFLGGSNTELGNGVAVDSSGDAFVVGFTQSFDFPVLDAFQPSCAAIPGAPNMCVNAFVTELSPGGSALVFSTYLGGAGSSFAQGVSLDPNRNIYVTGYTNTTDFPVVNAFQSSFPGNAAVYPSAFVTEFAAGGGSLVYSTYLGGSGQDNGWSVAVDGFGEAFVTGTTTSTDFPVSNAVQSTNQGALEDAFVTGFQAGGKALIYSTYLGGPTGTSTGAWDIAVDSQGDGWVGGDSNATTFPAAMIRPEVVYRYGPPVAQGTLPPPVGATRGVAPERGNELGRGIASPLQSTSGVTKALAAAIALDAARVSAAPASVSFAAQVAGTTSAPQTVTISNPGTAPLTFAAIDASEGFTVGSGGTCQLTPAGSATNSVPQGGNCTVDVAFAPTAGGRLIGTLTLTDNGIGSPHRVAFSGTGQDFALTIDQSSATLRAGVTGTFILGIAPQGGFNQPLELSCDDPAPHSTCTISPASVTPGSNGATAVVSVATTAASEVGPRVQNGPPSFSPMDSRLRGNDERTLRFPASPFGSHPRPDRGSPLQHGPWNPFRGRPPGAPLPWLVALVLLAIVAAVSSSRREAARRGEAAPRPYSRRAAPVALALALLLVLAWAACGGGGKQGTPPGTYTITLKAADAQANLNHATTVTVTVH